MRKPVLCAGRLYCDLIFAGMPRFPTPGTEVFSSHLSLHPGGGAFITGATLAALGHSVSQFSVLPAPPFDMAVVTGLAAHGVSAKLCQPADANTDPQITVAIPSDGDRAFLTRAAGPALPEISTTTFERFAHLHIGELKTLQDNPTLLDQARSAGLTISLDCGWQDSFDPAVIDLIAAVDVFLPNVREAEALGAIGIAENCAALTVVKCGKGGARARHRTLPNWILAPTNSVAVVDATGAGDAFNGGFVSEWLQDASLAQCLAKGNAMGSAAIQAIGGAGGLSGSSPSGVAKRATVS